MKILSVTTALVAGLVLSGCVSAAHVYDRGYGPGYGYRSTGRSASFDRARVISAEPIYHTITRPVSRRVCRRVPVRHVDSDAGTVAGTILGGLLGGLAGHQVGSGSGQTAATVVGAIAGAAIGRHVTNDPSRVYRTMDRRCRMQRSYRSSQRLSGYRVTYTYNGERMTTRTAHDPGRWLRVRVAVTPAE